MITRGNPKAGLIFVDLLGLLYNPFYAILSSITIYLCPLSLSKVSQLGQLMIQQQRRNGAEG